MPAKLRPSISAPLLAAVLALVALVAPGAAFAVTSISFGHEDDGLFAGATCLNGRATPSSSLHLVWKSAGGSVKANVYTPVSSGGNWNYCSSSRHIVVGDVFKANDGSSTRQFTMPNVTIVVDRAADLYRGRAPANSDMKLIFHAGIFADFYQQVDLTSNSMGRWQYADPIVGGIDAYVEWYGPNGDVVGAHDAAPTIGVRVGSSTFTGTANPGQSIRLVLRDGISNERMAVGTAVADENGDFTGTFRNDAGDPFLLGNLDRVVGLSVASDLDWVVPVIQATADVAVDTVSGTCQDSGYLSDIVTVDIRRSGNVVGYSMFNNVDGFGEFEIDFSEPETLGFDPANIRHGDRIVVRCMLDMGDWVQKTFIVP